VSDLINKVAQAIAAAGPDRHAQAEAALKAMLGELVLYQLAWLWHGGAVSDEPETPFLALLTAFSSDAGLVGARAGHA